MALTSYTSPLDDEQVTMLKSLLERENFEFLEKPHTLFAAKKGKLNISVYQKGPKVLVQGKETEDFVRFHLEPDVLGEARLGYEEVHNPDMFEPHFGIDESGKGDYFGPLVIAGAYTDSEITRHLIDAGIQDSKRISSDARIRQLAASIRDTRGIVYETITVTPESYNRMYKRFGNVNRLLAAGHAKVIETLARRVPSCRRSLSDQFARGWQLESATRRLGLNITIQQRTHAESDTAVAAASILAREKFIDWIDAESEKIGITLPRGAGPAVLAAGGEIVTKNGAGFLNMIAKTHFRTTEELL
jgi:ribonuclease HIII